MNAASKCRYPFSMALATTSLVFPRMREVPKPSRGIASGCVPFGGVGTVNIWPDTSAPRPASTTMARCILKLRCQLNFFEGEKVCTKKLNELAVIDALSALIDSVKTSVLISHGELLQSNILRMLRTWACLGHPSPCYLWNRSTPSSFVGMGGQAGKVPRRLPIEQWINLSRTRSTDIRYSFEANLWWGPATAGCTLYRISSDSLI
jgi:hypothetical protein